MVNIELRREKAELIQKMRAILDRAEAHKRGLNADESKDYNDADRRVTEISEVIERSEKLGRFEAEGERILNPFPTSLQNGKAQSRDSGGFSGLGELLHSVYQFRKEGVRDDRLEALRETREQSFGTGAMGGFNVPEQFKPDLLQVQPQDAIVMPRATVIPPGDPPDAKLIMPSLDQTAGQNIYGGLVMTHGGEAINLVETDAHFKQITMEPKKIAGYLVCTNELLNNWQASSTILSNLMVKAITGQVDYDCLRGDGVNKSIGLISAPCAVNYNRATNNLIDFPDIYGMLARLKMGGSPVWLASQTCIPELASMVDGGNHAVWLGSRADGGMGAAQGMPGGLLGYPIIFCDKLPALGTKGDLCLVDLSYYLVKLGSGPTIDISKELLFLSDRVVFRVTWRVDGKPWLTEALGLEGSTGNTVSPFVILDVA